MELDRMSSVTRPNVGVGRTAGNARAVLRHEARQRGHARARFGKHGHLPDVDDWRGFYDHVEPPRVDENGYGLRVPGLMMSPYAKEGYIDHQTLTFDAYLKFIEDRFLDGQRLDPKTDGRPDSRPTVREDLPILGDLRREFDFNQPPRPPLILDPAP